MISLPFFGEQKLLLAFEYGMTIAKVAKEQNVEITHELMERAEVMILNEFKTKTPTQLAQDMAQNILSVFELDLSK